MNVTSYDGRAPLRVALLAPEAGGPRARAAASEAGAGSLQGLHVVGDVEMNKKTRGDAAHSKALGPCGELFTLDRDDKGGL